MLYKASKRLIHFDNIFEMFAEDIQINQKYFKKLLETPLLNNSEEVLTMHRNMGIISARLNEFTIQMEEATNKELLKD